MTVDNELLNHYPADEQDRNRGKFDEEWKLRKRNLGHGQAFKIDEEIPLPNEVHLKSSPRGGFLIGEFAMRAGIRPSAVRYYESLGLLPPPMRRGRWRVYSLSELNRLKLVIAARRLGFTVSELTLLAKANPSDLRSAARERANTIRASMVKLATAIDRLEDLAACSCSISQDCLLFNVA